MIPIEDQSRTQEEVLVIYVDANGLAGIEKHLPEGMMEVIKGKRCDITQFMDANAIVCGNDSWRIPLMREGMKMEKAYSIYKKWAEKAWIEKIPAKER